MIYLTDVNTLLNKHTPRLTGAHLYTTPDGAYGLRACARGRLVSGGRPGRRQFWVQSGAAAALPHTYLYYGLTVSACQHGAVSRWPTGDKTDAGHTDAPTASLLLISFQVTLLPLSSPAKERNWEHFQWVNIVNERHVQ